MPNQPHRLSNFHGTGIYNAAIVPIPLPKQQVQAMLPPALILAAQNITPAEQHPVLLMFGAQEQVSPRPCKLFEWTYLEFAIGLPYVQWSKPQAAPLGPFLFMPRLYLNRRRPILAGCFYGFAKEKASIGADDRHYLVNDVKSRQLLIRADFQSKTKLAPSADLPLFEQAIPALLQQPLLGRNRLGLFSQAHFDWGLSQAKIQAIEANIEIAQPFLPALRPERFHRPGLDTAVLGAFRLVTQWSLSRPYLL